MNKADADEHCPRSAHAQPQANKGSREPDLCPAS